MIFFLFFIGNYPAVDSDSNTYGLLEVPSPAIIKLPSKVITGLMPLAVVNVSVLVQSLNLPVFSNKNIPALRKVGS